MAGEYTATVGVVEEDLVDITALGRGIELESSEEVEFTEDLANWLLGDPTEGKARIEDFAADRKLRQPHVDYLVTTMRGGLFRTELVQLAICFVGRSRKTAVRINGQHTCWARTTIGEDYIPPGTVKLMIYRAKTDADLARLYASFDRGAARNKAQVTLSYLSSDNDFEAINIGVRKKLPTGLSSWLFPELHVRRRHSPDALAVLMQTDHRDLVIKVGKFLTEHPISTNRHVHRGPVIAAMLATFDKAPRIALSFWTAVATGLGFDGKSDPRYKLHNILREGTIGNSSKAGKKSMSGEQMYRYCIVGWNAHRDSKTPQYLRALAKGDRPEIK